MKFDLTYLLIHKLYENTTKHLIATLNVLSTYII